MVASATRESTRRTAATVSWLTRRGVLRGSGGYDGSDDLGDTHVLSITETLQGPTLKAGPLVLATHSTPLARSQHTLVSTPGVPNASYRVLAADGRDNVAVLEGTPSEGGVASDGIPARGAQCVLFGGYASGKGVLGDTWVLDLSTRRWLRPSVGKYTKPIPN